MPVVKLPIDRTRGGVPPPEPVLRVARWLGFDAHDAWKALAQNAATPNPFTESWVMQPALEAFDPERRVRLALLEQGGTLLGLMPLAHRTYYDSHLLPHLANWLHPNAFCGAPLVAAGAEHAFWRGLLGWADKNAGSALFLHLAQLPGDGPLFAALRDVCAAERRKGTIVHRFERAQLASNLTPEAYFDASMSAKKRKELRRQFTRLTDLGTVKFERRENADGLNEWIAAFLRLERAGWKGAQGSALACDPAGAQFFRRALTGAQAAHRLERLAITLDGEPIAMLANFITPPGAFSFKTAFDERFARFSPGVLLQRENLDLLARSDIDWCDSCAAADHPMIERIWREKRPIVRVSLPIGGPIRRAAGALLMRVETGAMPKGL